MTETQFLELQKRSETLAYTSLAYSDYHSLANYKVLCDNSSLILLYGFNAESAMPEYHWACTDCDVLLAAISGAVKTAKVTFIPPPWVQRFESCGFVVEAIWNEYFAALPTAVPASEPPIFLQPCQCEEASKLTLACRGQSRGFTGQTTQWIFEWLECSDADYSNNAIIIHRQNGAIAGLICVATYAHGSENGAILWVRELAVSPAYQRHGIGRKLLLQAFAYGTLHGAVRGFLMADECNSGAIHLYESIGFRRKPVQGQIDMLKI